MKKILNIVLIGFICFMLVGCTAKEDNNVDKDTNKNGESTSKKDFVNDNKSYFIKIDGKKYYAGDKIADLSKSGFTIKSKEADVTVPANKYMIGVGNMMNSSDVNIFDVTSFNPSAKDIKVSESVIGGISLSAFDVKKDSVSFEIYGGIKIGSTRDDVIKAFGEASMVIGDTNPSLKYESSETYRSFDFSFDEEDKVSSITWKNLVFNK